MKKRCILKTGANIIMRHNNGQRVALGFARNTIFYYDYNKYGKLMIIKGDLHLTVSDQFFQSNFSIMAASDLRQPSNSNSRKRG